jgi:hypothetical protein
MFMADQKDLNISRRRWIGIAAGPALVGAVGAAIANGALGAEMPLAQVAKPKESGTRTFNVRDYGAVGDGKALDTRSIQDTIDACAADRGGVVLVPAGTFLIGPIQLKSNVTLRIAADGKLLAETTAGLYGPANGIPLAGDHTMGDGNVGLVYASNAENVAIEGSGTIDGQGAAVRTGGLSGNRRPHLVLFYKCKNVSIRDVYLFQSAFHTCRICNSSYVHIDGVRINSRVAGNNDGFHFISSEYVNIANCNVRCQDDACALFGSCKFVMVTNCSFSTRWSVFRFGGGVAENIVVSNCVMSQVFGCPIKLRCQPGSRYENMSFSNLIFQDVSGPISIGAGPQREGDNRAANTPGGIVRNISFSNISGNVLTKETKLDDSEQVGLNRPGEQHSCIILNCVKGNTIENISLSDIRFTFGGGGTAEDANRRELPNIASEYFALGPMPAYGLYARNVRALSVNNVRLQTAMPDLRPAIVLDGVQDATIAGLSADANKEAESLLRFINTTDTLVSSPRVLTPAAVFLRVEGKESRDITVDGGDLSKAEQPLQFAGDARKDAVKVR